MSYVFDINKNDVIEFNGEAPVVLAKALQAGIRRAGGSCLVQHKEGVYKIVHRVAKGDKLIGSDLVPLYVISEDKPLGAPAPKQEAAPDRAIPEDGKTQEHGIGRSFGQVLVFPFKLGWLTLVVFVKSVDLALAILSPQPVPGRRKRR